MRVYARKKNRTVGMRQQPRRSLEARVSQDARSVVRPRQQHTTHRNSSRPPKRFAVALPMATARYPNVLKKSRSAESASPPPGAAIASHTSHPFEKEPRATAYFAVPVFGGVPLSRCHIREYFGVRPQIFNGCLSLSPQVRTRTAGPPSLRPHAACFLPSPSNPRGSVYYSAADITGNNQLEARTV